MTVKDVEERLERIRASRYDSESAHNMEDGLWEAVLQSIVDDTAENPVEMARLALTSNLIEFDRWYAWKHWDTKTNTPRPVTGEREQLIDTLTPLVRDAFQQMTLEERALVARYLVPVPEGCRLILASNNLLDFWGTRTDRGEKITVEWGEPSPEGWYTPIFTIHFDDVLTVQNITVEDIR